jgi:hypothetical protein
MNKFFKYLLIVFLIHSTMFFYACSQAFVHIPDEQADKEQIELAQSIADQYFTTLQEGNTYDFTGKATDLFIKSFTPEIQQKSFEQMTSQFGTCQSLEYAETWVHTNGEELNIIRFKAVFSEARTDTEVRVILDGENLLAGFWVRPWKNELR